MQTLTFFMLVTNRDVLIADYAIASYKKLVPVLQGKYDWKLVIYANCLTESNKLRHFEHWRKFPFAEIYDNAAHCSPTDFVPRSKVYSDDGGVCLIDGPYESCDVIWTREFSRFTSDYWATVDADFEILKTDFIEMALECLTTKSNLVCVSSEYSPTYWAYETYSKQYGFYVERYHTWFCIYKKIAQCCTTSHFCYEEIGPDGKKYIFDSAARFQRDLKIKFHYELSACNILDTKYMQSFIHYSAFSKNKSLDSKNKVLIYRIISILSQKGIFIFPRKFFLNLVLRVVFSIIKACLYSNIDIERTVLQFDNKLDT